MTFSINLFYWFSTWQYIQKQVFGNKVNQNPYLRSVFENEIRTELCRGTFDAIIVEMTYSFGRFLNVELQWNGKAFSRHPKPQVILNFIDSISKKYEIEEYPITHPSIIQNQWLMYYLSTSIWTQIPSLYNVNIKVCKTWLIPTKTDSLSHLWKRKPIKMEDINIPREGKI